MQGKFNNGQTADMVSKSIDHFKRMKSYYGKAILKVAYARVQGELKLY